MAYALESLIQILEQDHTHLPSNITPRISPLLKISLSVRDTLGKISPLCSRSDLEALGLRIRDSSQEAEDIVESYITSQLLLGFSGPVSQLKSLSHIETELDSVNNVLLEMVKSNSNLDSAPPPIASTHKGLIVRVVGFEKPISELQGLVLGNANYPDLRVIPIIGMGGSGKTTLAQEVYKLSSGHVSGHFDARAWVTISQNFDARNTFLTLLKDLRKLTSSMEEESDERLGEYVHKTLMGRRYFIVVDDLWETTPWDKLKKFFPNERNGSRIFVTTREKKVVDYVKSGSTIPHQMEPLDEVQSWTLLRERVFGENCPELFKDTGEKIAINCKGLPLAIVVMAGVLYTTEQTIAFWELIEENVGSEVAKHDFKFMEVLALSYVHLPYHLKPCFLYVGAFPEDHEIRASRMVNLLVSEGLMKPIEGKNLEEVAEAYLKDLINRNLIVVRQTECSGKMKTFGIHDLLRTLSHLKALEDKFIWFENVEEHKDVETVRRVCARPSSEFEEKMDLISPARSFVCIGHPPLDMANAFLPLKLLRVLDVFNIEFYQFPPEILLLLNLRYLAFTGYSDFPVEIARLKYLRTLIIRRIPTFRSFELPSELWDMAQLRNVKSKETCLLYFPMDDETVILDNLQTLSYVQSSGITNEVLKRILNVKKLGLCCNDHMPEEIDLSLLEKLEKLKCTTDWSLASHRYLFSLTLPDSLVKLTLNLCKIPKEFMARVAELPNLEQLKLLKSDFLGPNNETTEEEWVENAPEWETDDEGFRKLKSLEMRDLNLVNWIADDASFPQLKEIIIRDCCEMKEIPIGIGETPTLEKIEVDESSPFVVSSVQEIANQQKDLGNITLDCIFYTAF